MKTFSDAPGNEPHFIAGDEQARHARKPAQNFAFQVGQNVFPIFRTVFRLEQEHPVYLRPEHSQMKLAFKLENVNTSLHDNAFASHRGFRLAVYFHRVLAPLAGFQAVNLHREVAGRNVGHDNPENVQFLLQNAAVEVKAPVKTVVQGRPLFEDGIVHVVLAIAQVVDVVVVDVERVPGVQFDVQGGQHFYGVVERGEAGTFQVGKICSFSVKKKFIDK